jgi:hypothetical protein
MSSGSRIDTGVEIVITLYYNELQVYQCLHIHHPTSYLAPHLSVVHPGEDAGRDEEEGDVETDGWLI